MAALVLLALSIGLVIWPKFAELVQAVWSSFKSGVREILDFYDEISHRLKPESPPERGDQPRVSTTAPVEE